MIDYLKKLFILENKEDKNTAEYLFKDEKDKKVDENCNNCIFKDNCKVKKADYLCKFIEKIDNYDKNKPSILLFDDNYGIISVLLDDLKELSKECEECKECKDKKINLDNYNIITFSSQYAGFQLKATLRAYNGLNIKYGIFDLTLGGGVYNNFENIILDGVDAFKDVKDYNKNLKFLFFTGNRLSPYINKNQKIIQKFKAYTNYNIEDYILYKTGLSSDTRREIIKKLLLEEI